MKHLTSFPVTLLAAITIACVASCSDHCTDVACGPAPPPLTVIVSDTVTVDTLLLGVTDTMLTVLRQTTEALVTLQRVVGDDTLTFDTLNPTAEMEYMLRDPVNLPDSIFMLRVERDGRVARRTGLTVQMVEGCCSYPIIGRFPMQLPEKP